MYGLYDDKNKFVPWLVQSLINNVDHIDLTKGEQKRDFINVNDVVNVYTLLLEKYKNLPSYSEFDVGTGEQIQLKDFILKVYQEIKKRQNINTKLNFGALNYREGEPMVVNEDLKPLYSLGWQPTITVEQGINDILTNEYFNKNKILSKQ